MYGKEVETWLTGDIRFARASAVPAASSGLLEEKKACISRKVLIGRSRTYGEGGAVNKAKSEYGWAVKPCPRWRLRTDKGRR